MTPNEPPYPFLKYIPTSNVKIHPNFQLQISSQVEQFRHWGYTCNTLSDSEKLELYKKITRSQINRMKVIQLTNKVAKTVIYDEEATTIDFSAGYDSLSEVHCCPLAFALLVLCIMISYN